MQVRKVPGKRAGASWAGTTLSLLVAGVRLITGASAAASLPSEGESVAVVYNVRQPGSETLALYYAQRRQVPSHQVLGLELPTGESMSRGEYERDLQRPLLEWLRRERLLTWRSDVPGEPREGGIEPASIGVESARVRYLVLCYGVPVKIAPAPGLSERGVDAIQPELRRNEATVDSELACLPQHDAAPRLTGVVRNPAYGSSNGEGIGPQSGVLMVARLDGASVDVARRLVDRALQAEQEGLWGRAYFDLRGLTNSSYRMGDQWLQQAAEWVQRAGYETVTDTNAATFGRGFPMSQIAFYAGWYEAQVSGPFTVLPVEFMPGAFAYHLHSFSATTLRTTQQHWVGPLLDRGATVTVGYGEEPYLSGTLDVGTFAGRWIQGGFSFGEAVYAALPVLSWQSTAVGDPLYRPFGRVPRSAPLGDRLRELHTRLSAATNSLVEWSQLQVVNLTLAGGAGQGSSELLDYLVGATESLRSPVLAEKLGDLEYRDGRIEPAIEAYRQSLAFGGSVQQRLRVRLTMATLQKAFRREAEALQTYMEVLRDSPDYPDRVGLLQEALSLARDLGRDALVREYEEALGYRP